jgi:TonB family protein
MKTKQNRGDVEVSFEVDKNGEPVNIKVEKSLCGKCDEEAIRLIKDGPKWKRKDRKLRTRITVPF